MRSSPTRSTHRKRTTFISDIHLGFAESSVEPLLSFLQELETETLYLVGDVFDLACSMSSHAWPQAHHDVIRRISVMAEQGTRVVYIPGNHDALVRGLEGTRCGNIEIRREVVHETADGRRFLVIHGDEFDDKRVLPPWLEQLGGRAYGVLLGLDRQLNTLAGALGLAPWRIAASLKQAAKSAVNLRTSFDEALVAEARRRGVDGVICGHFHRPELRDLGGVLYCNDGDWVESCTALAEDLDGRLALIHWRAELESAPSARAVAVVRAA
jgi:UDP-2,3-diacylglucosamine pyrophosphatase LpxH